MRICFAVCVGIGCFACGQAASWDTTPAGELAQVMHVTSVSLDTDTLEPAAKRKVLIEIAYRMTQCARHQINSGILWGAA